MRPNDDVVAIGGGFYGCTLALHARQRGARNVRVLERGDALLTRASYANQARIHNGYHYPRSLQTGLRSRLLLPRFVSAFAECVDDTFTKVYAIASQSSKVSARQFEGFCRRIGAPLQRAPREIRDLFDPNRVEAVCLAEEYAFNASLLAERMRTDLDAEDVSVSLETEVHRVRRGPDGTVVLECTTPDGDTEIVAGTVYCATYSRIGKLLADSGLPPIAFKHELTEMALVEVPEPIRDLGITLMCGPFFSIMPFPARDLHSLYHVRYTLHATWNETADPVDAYAALDALPKDSAFDLMIRDATRYVPALADCRRIDSNWEVRTVLPDNERDDGRPILLSRDHGLPGFHCVMGGKIDNVFDVLDALDTPAEVASR